MYNKINTGIDHIISIRNNYARIGELYVEFMQQRHHPS